MKKILLLMMMAGIPLFAAGQNESSHIYVDANNGSETQTGKSWDKAYSDLSEALEAAEAGDEIWVAAGTYTPSASDRKVSFQFKDGVDLYGGFTGAETERDQRDWENNETILSGEIGDPNTDEDNSLSVVIAANNVLDGFTVTGGYGLGGSGMAGPPLGGPAPSGPPPSGKKTAGGSSAGHLTPDSIISRGPSPGTGAGIIIWQVEPEIRNCTISGNLAGKAGGVYIVGKKAFEIDDSADETLPLFLNCEFTDNVAYGRGGAVVLDLGGGAWFIDTVFKGNSCLTGKGGAIYDDFGCSPYVINCLFEDNFSPAGAAMGNDGASNPVIYNSTFYHNEASVTGAALYQGSGPYNDPTVVNSVIWENICPDDEASIYNWNDCYTTVSYSIVEGGYVGTAILNEDPLYVNASTGEFESASAVFTAGVNGGKIGYDAEAAANRTEEEIASLQVLVAGLRAGYEPTELNRTNSASPDENLADNSILYVMADGKGNGSSWTSASGDLQDMIDQAGLIYDASGNAVQIWIAEGTYLTGTERSDSYVLRDGVEIYGGFSGSETDLDERDRENHKTVISGDIGVRDDANDNSYHVFIGADAALLDSLYITGGNADGVDGEVYDNKGGAVLNYWGGFRIIPRYEPTLGFDMTFNNCVFQDNYAMEGGAVYTYHGGNPLFTECSFVDNKANYGGATVDRAGTNSRYFDCEFTGNTARYKGGVLFVDYGSMATVEDCSFRKNEAGTSGGAVYVLDRASQAVPNDTDINLVDPDWSNSKDIYSSILIIDSTFSGNSAGVDGGVLFIYESSNLKVSGTDFTGNSAARNGNTIGLKNRSNFYVGAGNSLSEDDIYDDGTAKIIE